MINKSNKKVNMALTIAMIALTVIFLYPILLVLLNSFKNLLYISDQPFALPFGDLFAGFDNYVKGFTQSDFLSAFLNSLFITVTSVILILLFTSMTAWFIVRAKNPVTNVIYYLFVFSMIVPFQMIMFPMAYLADRLYIANSIGINLLYLGFGAGLSVFMFTGFVKGVPYEIEEASNIDGCNPIQCFFLVVLPLLVPTAITISILNAMWIWNDYLLPYLIIGTGDNRTIPVAIQMAMVGGYGNKDMGAFMAMLVLAMFPIVTFYVVCQKYIISGVMAGAVKG